MPERRAIVVLTASLLLLAACDTDDGRQLEEPTAQQRAAMPTTSTTTSSVPGLPLGEPSGAALTSTTGLAVAPTFAITGPWIEGAAIDPQYTCDGAGLAPLVAWTTPPPGTLELALMVTDPDAGDFVHWAVAGIPATAGQIGAGAVVPGAREGTNDFGNPGWGGPCPPSPGETHTYRWTLYALDQPNQLPDGFAGTDLQTLAFDTAFASAQLSGTYTRAG